MKIKFLFPIRHESVSGTTDYWYISLETCLYIHNYEGLFSKNVFKISILGFGIRREVNE